MTVRRERRGTAVARAAASAGALACAWAWPAGAGIAVEVEGVDGDLRDAVVAAVELSQYRDRDVTPARARWLYGRAKAQIELALEPYGYYDPAVESELREAGDGGWVATFRIDPGAPVTVRRVDIDVRPREGGPLELPPVRRTVEAFPLEPGERLDHAEYEEGKRAIATALRANGFLDAELRVRRVAVNAGARVADVDLEWLAGPRYRLGSAEFSPSQFRAGFLDGYVPWRAGDWYSTDALLTLQQRLVDTDYFETVSVEPALDRRADGSVPVDVIVTPNARNVYAAGVYYGTDFGVGARLAYERRWLNDRGHRLETRLEYSQRLEEYAVTYRIPRPDVDDRSYTVGVAYRDERSETATSRTLRVAAAESRSRWKGWQRTLGLQFLRGDFEIADERRRSTVFYGEGTLSRKQLDDFSFPREGWSLDLGVRAAPGGFVSDTSLAQAWATGRRLLRSGERSRFVLLGRVGALAADDFDALPPDLRFFAGGDRSIRGFDYQAIGETNAAGRVIGGRYLVVGSATYEHYFVEQWGAAAFVDAGDAFTRRFDANVAVGVGARWRSPVGMVRVDVAKPVVTRFDDGFRVHVTIGPDL
jgi:translocation and assembly module TamA